MTDSVKSMRLFFAIAAAAFMAACGVGGETCEEPEFYEFAQAGKRIDPPDDLDELASHKEMVIPEASPRPPRDRSAGCIDRPPTLRTRREREAAEPAEEN